MEILNNLEKYKILLASNSPRRRELLTGLNIPFNVVAMPNIDESYPSDLRGKDIPLYISRKKAAAYRSQLTDDTLLITADTIVWVDGEVLGKPEDAADAHKMLSMLSDKTHTVITAVTLLSRTKDISFAVCTDVEFAKISNEEIDYYITHYKPFDKAGAYGIQEWIGYVAVRGIKGSYFNVMGLPIQRLYEELKNW